MVGQMYKWPWLVKANTAAGVDKAFWTEHELQQYFEDNPFHLAFSLHDEDKMVS